MQEVPKTKFQRARFRGYSFSNGNFRGPSRHRKPRFLRGCSARSYATDIREKFDQVASAEVYDREFEYLKMLACRPWVPLQGSRMLLLLQLLQGTRERTELTAIRCISNLFENFRRFCSQWLTCSRQAVICALLFAVHPVHTEAVSEHFACVARYSQEPPDTTKQSG